MVEKILVSACLLGEPVRYDGGDKLCRDGILQRWIHEGRVVAVCPELAGGLSVPRLPSEVADGLGGAAVLSGEARVVDNRGNDVTSQFLAGAAAALAITRASGIRVAVLKEGSPSCGSLWSYDGTFASARVPLPGVTAALLEREGIRVFSEGRLAEAQALLEALEAAGSGREP